jgi:hypothetical protein
MPGTGLSRLKTAPASWQEHFRHWLAFWPLALPVLILLPSLGAFSYPVSSGYSDIPVAHYPNAVFLRQAVQTYHVVPLWSPSILSGYPFAADPLSGLWYPPGWLVLLLPLPFGFNFAIALHLVWGGMGMYALLREEGLGHAAALLGAVGFAAMPKLFAHYGAGHLTLLYAVSWTPWLLAAEARRATRDDRPSRLGWRSALILALIFLADPRWVVYAGAAWVAYRLIPARAVVRLRTTLKDRAAEFLSTAEEIALAGLLAAPLALPLFEYARLSTRNDLQPVDVFALSLPPASLLGLLFPTVKITHEWVLYPGSIILTLAILGVLWVVLHRRGRFWIALILASTLFSLGANIPPLDWLARLPGLDLLRVPPRALFLAGMGWSALAASAVEWVMTGFTAGEKKKAGMLLIWVSGFIVMLAVGIWALTRSFTASLAWGAGLTILASACLGFYLAGRLPANYCYGIILLLCLAELWWVDRQMFTTRPAEVVLSENEAVARYLKAQPGMFRVYSPSYSLPQQTAARFGLEQADGVDPLQLREYTAFMDQATGVPRTGYSVTVPPQIGGDPAVANAAYRPNLALLALLNVRYLVSEYDLTSAPGEPELALQTQIGRTRIYENTLAYPRAWVLPNKPGGDTGMLKAEIVIWNPNEIVIQARGPGTLVLSEVAYPGWVVRVDDQKAALETWSGLLRGVEIGPGLHRVVMSFHPLSVYLGLATGGLGWLVVIWLVYRRRDANR